MAESIQDFHRAPNDLSGFLSTNEIPVIGANHFFILSVSICVYLWFNNLSVVLKYP